MPPSHSSPRKLPPRAVVFDVGNVLVEWRPERVYRELIPDDAERAAFLERTGIESMNAAGDRGQLAEAVARNVAAHPADGALIQPWWDRWDEMFAPPIPRTFALMESLRDAGVQILGLTNFASDTWPKACAKHPALSRFDHVVVSGEEGVMKPEPAIYALLEERSGLRGPDLFFTDDREENIQAADERGWRTHLFRGPEGLAEALSAVGL